MSGFFVSIAKRWSKSSRIAAQLQQSRERLDFALQSGRMGTWDLDLSTRTVSCSPEMLALWGVSPEEFQGQRTALQSKVHPDDLPRMNEAIEAAIQSSQIYELEYRITPSPGVERWVVSRGRCFCEPGTERPIRLSGVVYDVTDRKRRESELEEALRSRDRFLSIAGHELRTPLTGLQLLIQLKQREFRRGDPSASSKERWEASLQQQFEYVRRISQLVDDILDESRISGGRLQLRPEVFDLNEMITEVLARFRAMAEAFQVEVHFTPTDRAFGKWDRFRLEQVLMNLLTNAIRYGNRKPIHVKVEWQGESASFSVIDQGIGIHPSDHARIFERFERAVSENEVSGLGLGLYISREIVRAHGGEIHVRSEAGKGSVFTVVIPAGFKEPFPEATLKCAPESRKRAELPLHF